MNSTQKEHWHLDKRVSVSHIFTTLSMIIAAMWYIQTIETRLAVLETNDMNFYQSLKRIEAGVERLHDKVDDLNGRRHRN